MQPGGINLGCHVRRDSVEPKDLFHTCVLAIDTFALALRNAARIITDGTMDKLVQEVGRQFQGYSI